MTPYLQQDDKNALLQQALAMSMDDPASSHDARDIDMSNAVSDDSELALVFNYHCRILQTKQI